MAETNVPFVDLDSEPEQISLATRIIDNYLNPSPFPEMERNAREKVGKAQKKEVLEQE